MSDVIITPDLAAREVVRGVKDVVATLAPAFETWDFFLGRDGIRYDHERGQQYQALLYTPRRRVTTEEVRAFFWATGFTGNVSAHLAWVLQHRPLGFHVTIPEDNRLMQMGDLLYAPYHYAYLCRRERRFQEFHLNRTLDGWGEACTFVGYQLA